MNIKQLLHRPAYHNLNTIYISRDHLLANYHYLRTRNQNMHIAPVIKSNAYGHGLVQIAKLLDSHHVPFFCVDSLYEAYELYKAGITTPILIMGYIDPENLKVKKLPFSYAVYDEALLQTIARYQPHAGIHIKIDTGMHRLGVPVTALSAFLDTAKATGVRIEGIMSHFASADEINNTQTHDQLP